jgi:2-hydroxychromene-2-carboxylate isomerase
MMDIDPTKALQAAIRIGFDEAQAQAANEIEKLRAALDKAADALHDAGCYDAWAAARATLGKKV